RPSAMASVLGVVSDLPAPPRRSLAAGVEERLLIPAYASSWAFAPILAHRTMSLPLQLTGEVRRRSVHFGDSRIELVGIGRAKVIDSLTGRLFGELPEAGPEGWRLTWSPEGLSNPEADLV